MKRIAGFTILEFLIASTIGTLLIAGVGAVYLSNKATFTVQEALARLQENGRYANYILSREIRMAGFQGCTNQKQLALTNLVSNASTMLNYDKPLQGFDGNGASFSPSLPTNISAKQPLSTSDVIEIRMASNSVHLSTDMTQVSSPISVFSGLGAQSGMPLIITNCVLGDIFVAGTGTGDTSITHPTGVNTSNNLSTSYLANAQVMRFIYYAFYVKNTGRVNNQNQPILALVRLDANGNEEEIAEGVEELHVTYGVDTDNDNTVNAYQTAAQVNSGNNWNNVISVQINLLLATTENVADKARPYTFNSATATPTDRKIRREWITFITLRNRGLPV
ncbi:type IV pilus assembly protein PilW [Legionella beliardensis]|uniref:Type IV pilus assembly protein PilW n=1 Tax=Legionella beliardensis TaxID=91822 RepID=A0A378HZ64_9GAMM|nr:PilW family protein [Legionella beliardensis]STX28219.1 type IV pilus assembly protein PilW [Legionella beliardensis]